MTNGVCVKFKTTTLNQPCTDDSECTTSNGEAYYCKGNNTVCMNLVKDYCWAKEFQIENYTSSSSEKRLVESTDTL